MDYDEELRSVHGMYGSMEAELEVQRTIKRAELTAFLCLLMKVIGPGKSCTIMSHEILWWKWSMLRRNARRSLEKMPQDKGALPKEERDVVRGYKAVHEENFLSSWLREDVEEKEERRKNA